MLQRELMHFVVIPENQLSSANFVLVSLFARLFWAFAGEKERLHVLLVCRQVAGSAQWLLVPPCLKPRIEGQISKEFAAGSP